MAETISGRYKLIEGNSQSVLDILNLIPSLQLVSFSKDMTLDKCYALVFINEEEGESLK